MASTGPLTWKPDGLDSAAGSGAASSEGAAPSSLSPPPRARRRRLARCGDVSAVAAPASWPSLLESPASVEREIT